MNGNGPTDVHYINTAFPYSVGESFMDFFEGLSQAPLHYAHPGLLHDQDTLYWSMNMNSYKFEVPGPESTYYGLHEVNDHLSRLQLERGTWELQPAAMNTVQVMNTEQSAEVEIPLEENTTASVGAGAEECTSGNEEVLLNSQVAWQDDIDPDNMTYEELLDLGEAVGTESRGLPQELIDLLPTSKYKSGRMFLRKKSEERCVICQMRYKHGERQINLPCKHIYHSECGSKWLSINKTCPICNTEVFGEESTR